MRGAIFPFILAELELPSAEQWFHFAAPWLAIGFVWWLIENTDWIIHRLFPDLEWEKSLGWLNIRARRRAELAWRWLWGGIYVLMGCALFGILWAAQGLQQLGNWSDPWVMGDLVLRVPVLLMSLAIWFLYLGCGLIPKLRRQREEREMAELKRFRVELEEAEREREKRPSSRIKSPLLKPRTNAIPESVSLDRTRRRR